MIKQLLKGIAIFSLWSVCVLSLSVTTTYASPVTISQTGSVVTATNGTLAVTTKNYGIVLRSPATIDDLSTNNKYGFAYSDSNPYANGFERLSTNGGSTWTTESSGNRDLMFTIYK
jgi:hypothetical protein